MRKSILVAWAVVCLASAYPLVAQVGDGSLRGYVRDVQGAVIPGVTITASSPALIQPVSAVSDSEVM